MAFTAGQKVRASQLQDMSLRSIQAYTAVSSGTGTTTTDTIQVEKCTMSVVAGRRYRGHHVRNQASSAGTLTHTNRYRVGVGAAVTTSDTLIAPFLFSLGASYTTVSGVFVWTATFTGQATFGVSSFVNSTTGLVDAARNREMWIEDIG